MTPPLCACGCGLETKLTRRTPGAYSKYKHGHGLRNPDVVAQRAETFRSRQKLGLLCACGCGQTCKLNARSILGHMPGPSWIDGRTVNAGGYVSLRLPTHPNAGKNGRVLEHRYVMECHLRRLLEPTETVHHLNGDRSDNRLENLELWNSSQPYGQRVCDKVAWAKEILALYSANCP